MKNLNLNPFERDIIAEFIFSNQTNVLIKHDAIKLINVLAQHHIITEDKKAALRKDIDNKKDGVVECLEYLLGKNIPPLQGLAIMNEYFGKQKYEL